MFFKLKNIPVFLAMDHLIKESLQRWLGNKMSNIFKPSGILLCYQLSRSFYKICELAEANLFVALQFLM